MELFIAFGIPALVIISWLAIGYWSKSMEEYLEEESKPKKKHDRFP